MTDPTEIARVAAGLTRASRRALVKINGQGWTEEGSPGPARVDVYSLWWGRDGKKGLTERPIPFQVGASLIPGWRWSLTPFGRQVREHILREKSGG